MKIINTDLIKEWHYQKNGTLLPENVTAYSNKKVWWICSLGHEWEATVSDRSNGKGCPYCSGLRVIPGETDLKTLFPDLAAQWNYRMNGASLPENVTAHSNNKVWWICSLNHEWEATINSRSKGSSCPYCSGRRVIPGETDLRTLFPDLADEWNYCMNGALLPENVTAHSNNKVWWICSLNHEWEATINSRSKGSSCPYCLGQRIISGKTDLKTLFPDLANEWNYLKNSALLPENMAVHSKKKVWWICSLNHEWEAAITDRTRGNGCPYCSGRRIIPGETDLNTLYPSLADEWHYPKNGALLPENMAVHSKKKVWWICSIGHEWEARVSDRTRGNGCPYCSGLKVIPGKTDLKTLFPDLADEWYYHMNGDLLPENMAAHSNKIVWWICINNHVWKTTLNDRVNGSICPYCSGRRAIPGKTDLKTLFPDLADEWHYHENGALRPENVTAHTKKKVWWICSMGHEWKAAVNNRSRGCGCPRCFELGIKPK